MKKGQFEMLGLAIIVVVVVLGVVLYISFGTQNTTPQTRQYSTSFQTALLDTTIPACDMSVAQAIRACKTGGRYGCDPCVEVERTVKELATYGIGTEYKYILTLESVLPSGEDIVVKNDCEKENPEGFYSQYQNPIPIAQGGAVNMILSLCR